MRKPWVQILAQPFPCCVDLSKSAYLSLKCLTYKVERTYLPTHSLCVQMSSLVKGPIWHPGHGQALNGSNYYYNYYHSLAWASGSPKMPEDQLQIIRLHVAHIWV